MVAVLLHRLNMLYIVINARRTDRRTDNIMRHKHYLLDDRSTWQHCCTDQTCLTWSSLPDRRTDGWTDRRTDNIMRHKDYSLDDRSTWQHCCTDQTCLTWSSLPPFAVDPDPPRRKLCLTLLSPLATPWRQNRKVNRGENSAEQKTKYISQEGCKLC